MNLAPVRKWAVAVVGFAVAAVAAGLVHGTALIIVTAVIGVATSLGVYTVKNQP